MSPGKDQTEVVDELRRLTAPNQAPPSGRDEVDRHESRQRVSHWVYVVPVVLVLALVGYGAWTHWSTNNRAAESQQQAEEFAPTVRTVAARREAGPVNLTLPGTTAPFDIARLYAHATGYVAERRVDIGSRVKKGDLLLRIGAPDLNAQLAQAIAQLGQTQAALVQARANVVSAQSNVGLARVTNSRTSTLAPRGGRLGRTLIIPRPTCKAAVPPWMPPRPR